MRAAQGMCCGAAALALTACGGPGATGLESGDALAALAVIDQRAVHCSGSAAVRGTAFSIRCTAEPVCTFTVTAGLVVVSTPDGRRIEVAAGEEVSIGRQDDDATGADPGARSVELDRAPFSLDLAEQQSREVAANDWLRRNEPLDAATGPLDRYVVDVHLGGLGFRAAQGEVLADANGDRTGFRGDIDVGEYAQWGVGLYEVTAATTGTPCDARAFVRIVGRSPLTTVGGIVALLAMVLGGVGLFSALRTVSDVSLFGSGGGDG